MDCEAPTEPASTIADDQNLPHQIQQLAAQRAVYARTERIFLVHSFFAAPVAGIWTIGMVIDPQLTAYGTAWGFGLSLVDMLLLQPWQARLRQTGARIQEAFDCKLFGLPAQAVKVGPPVPADQIAEYAAAYERKEPGLASLRNWYPLELTTLPLGAARIGCQLTNISWDGRQRRNYAFALLAILLAFIALVVALGIGRETQVKVIATAVIAPLAPAILLFIRQYKENLEAAARLGTLAEHAANLSEKLLEGTSEAELLQGSRALQDEIFEHRRKNVPVFDWIYWLMREKNETIMNRGAKQFADQWRSRGKN